ncbi:MAG: hypothetical protein ACT4PI_12630 [Actinomycetota bacterium]
MPTRTRIIIGCLIATVGFVGIVVGVLGTVLDWGAETTTEAVADENGGEVPDKGDKGDDVEETPEEFLAALATAIQDGDADFQLERLHPAVIERYGEDACAADIATRTDPTRAFAVTRVREEPEPFDYASDGLSETIPETTVVEAQVTADGATNPQEVHVAEVDGEFRYFSDCGTPATA